jgi:hypothetical protein
VEPRAVSAAGEEARNSKASFMRRSEETFYWVDPSTRWVVSYQSVGGKGA